MGIIRAAVGSVTGALGNQFLDVVEPVNMGAQTLMTQGRIKNKSGFASSDIISNGSCIHVYDNQFMILTDGGKIIDYTAEPGYFIVDNSSQPSLFQGQFKASLKDVWERFKFNGSSPQSQKVFYINTQEIKGIKFGTRNAINYFDGFYNAELFLRAFGTYSIRVENPLLFYANGCPRNATQVDVPDINEQYLNEFLEALQAAINQMSADGERISFVASKSTTLSKYMAGVLDDTWKELRGIEVVSVGIGSISYDEESQKLINMRNQGAMMQDPTIREGYVQSAVAQGLQNAGSNPAGAGAAFMGMGMGMNAAGGFMQSASATNAAQMQAQYQQPQQYQQQAQSAQGALQGGGARVKQPGEWFCPECGTLNAGKFCMNCGTKKPE
jgi:membrane protease subunit (stomatin/prohibitin family)